jgi:hypothetical protein
LGIPIAEIIGEVTVPNKALEQGQKRLRSFYRLAYTRNKEKIIRHAHFQFLRAFHLELFSGIVKTGIGGALVGMSKLAGLKEWGILTGLSVRPGTLNL